MAKNNFHRDFSLIEQTLPDLTDKRGDYLNARYKLEGFLPEHEISIKVVYNWRRKEPHKKGQFRNFYIDLDFNIKRKGKKFDLLYHEQFFFKKHSHEGYFLDKWNKSEKDIIIYFESLGELIDSAFLEFKNWLDQIKNYKYALLAGEKKRYNEGAAWFTNDVQTEDEGDVSCVYQPLWVDTDDVKMTSAKKMKPHIAIQTFESLATGLTKIENSYLRADYQIDGFLPEHRVSIRVMIGFIHDKSSLSGYRVNSSFNINYKGEYFDTIIDIDSPISHSEKGYYCEECHRSIRNKKKPKPLPYFQTVEEVLINDLSGFAKYLNNMKDYKYLFLNGIKKKSGSTFATLQKEKERATLGDADCISKPLWKGISA